MGLNNKYIITIGKDFEKAAIDYLNKNCKISEGQLPNPFESKDNYISIWVEVDIAIKRYIRNYYYYPRDDSGYQEERIENFIENNKIYIGGLDIYKQEFGNKINLRFRCVAGGISQLFTDSISIRKWFANLCEVTNAETGIFFRENHYLELFWYKGTSKSLKIGDSVFNELGYKEDEKYPSFRESIKDLLIAAFDYSYELERK